MTGKSTPNKLKPGDILKITNIDKDYDAQEYTWVNTETGHKVKFLTKLSPVDLEQLKSRLAKNEQIYVVCITDGVVTEKDYEGYLYDYYYDRLKLRVAFNRLVQAKWEDIMASNNSNIIVENNINKVFGQYCINLFRLDNKWVFPIVASKYTHYMTAEEQWHVFPHHPDTLNIGPIKPALYRNRDVLPKRYSCEITFDDKTFLPDVNLEIHGFLDPQKWHCHVWKHLVANVSGADMDEPSKWQNIINPLPSQNVFQACQWDDGYNKCVKCDGNVFQNVHCKILSDIQKYFEIAVTLLGENGTIIICKQQKSDSAFDVAIIMPIQNVETHALYVELTGYIGNNNSAFLFPRTCFFKKKTQSPWASTYRNYDAHLWREGRITNVIQQS